jgi:Tfp pilus assembly protein FimV
MSQSSLQITRVKQKTNQKAPSTTNYNPSASYTSTIRVNSGASLQTNHDSRHRQQQRKGAESPETMSFCVSRFDQKHLLTLRNQSSSPTSSLTSSPSRNTTAARVTTTTSTTATTSGLEMHLEESNQFYQKLESQIAVASDKIRIEEQRLQQLQRLQGEQQKRKQAGKVVKTVRWKTVPTTTKPYSYTDSSPTSSLLWPWRFLLLVALVQFLVIMAPQYKSFNPVMDHSPQSLHRLVKGSVDIVRNEAKDMNQNQGQRKERLKRFAPFMGPFGNKMQK